MFRTLPMVGGVNPSPIITSPMMTPPMMPYAATSAYQQAAAVQTSFVNVPAAVFGLGGSVSRTALGTVASAGTPPGMQEHLPQMEASLIDPPTAIVTAAIVGVMLLYFRAANDERELIESSAFSVFAGAGLAKAVQYFLAGNIEVVKIAAVFTLFSFALGIGRMLSVDSRNALTRPMRDIHRSAETADIGITVASKGAPKLSEWLGISDVNDRLTGPFSILERVLRKDPELQRFLRLDSGPLDLRAVMGDVPVLMGRWNLLLRERCHYEHAMGMLMVGNNASQSDIVRGLVEALICRALERAITTKEVIAISRYIKTLPPESMGREMKEIRDEALRLADAIRDNLGLSPLPSLSEGWARRYAGLAYEYALRRHPAAVEALISRVMARVGSNVEKVTRHTFNRYILPLLNAISWPMTRAAGFVHRYILPRKLDKLHPVERNLLVSGARGRRDVGLQHRVVQGDLFETLGFRADTP